MQFNNVKDSGERQEFDTGSKRDTQDGKGRPDLIPIEPLRRLAKHYENGAKKYGNRNWEKGQPLSRYYASAMRHMWDYMEGDYSEDHLAAAAWNIFSMIATQERIIAGKLPKELDDIGAIQAYEDHLLEEGSKQFITVDDTIRTARIKASQIAQSVKSLDNIRAQNKYTRDVDKVITRLSDIGIVTQHIKVEDIKSINSVSDTATSADTLIKQAENQGVIMTGSKLYVNDVHAGTVTSHNDKPAINAGELLVTVKVDTLQAIEALEELSNILDDIQRGLETLEDKTPEGYTRIMNSGLYKIPNVDTPMTIAEIIEYYDNKKSKKE